LAKVGNFEFNGTVGDFADMMTARLGHPVLWSDAGLKDLDLSADSKLAGEFNDVPLRVALAAFLEPHGLSYYVTPEAVVIADPDRCTAQTRLVVRIFPVYDLLTPDVDSTDELIDGIVNTVQPGCWQQVGGSSSIETLDPPMLVVRATLDQMIEIEDYLAGLRQARALLKDIEIPRYLRQDFVLGRRGPLPKIEGGGSIEGFIGLPQVPLTKEETRDLVDYLRRTVSRDSWKDPEVQIEHWENRVTVRQTLEVLAAISRELKRLGVENYALPGATRPFVH
jgi:hypothetical protein